jgi:hypothetical protein
MTPLSGVIFRRSLWTGISILSLFVNAILRRHWALKYDAIKVGKLLTAFKQAQNRLPNLARLSEAEFLAEPDKIGSAKYQFIVAIEDRRAAFFRFKRE